MDKKGFFTILTSFFLVIAIILGVLAFIALYGKIFEIKKGTEFNAEILTNAYLFREHILSCHEKTYLTVENMENNPCVKLTSVKGYEVIQEEFRGCQERKWKQGELDAKYGRYVYWISIEQENGKSCLGKLFIYQ